MVEKREHPSEQEEQPREQPERGTGEFEDPDEFEDEEDELTDEDADLERNMIGTDAPTGEVGSEGGGRGDIQVGRDGPDIIQGSESTTTATPDRAKSFRDRRSGPGY